MTIGEIENQGVRAWILIRVGSPEAAAERLYSGLGY